MTIRESDVLLCLSRTRDSHKDECYKPVLFLITRFPYVITCRFSLFIWLECCFYDYFYVHELFNLFYCYFMYLVCVLERRPSPSPVPKRALCVCVRSLHEPKFLCREWYKRISARARPFCLLFRSLWPIQTSMKPGPVRPDSISKKHADIS